MGTVYAIVHEGTKKSYVGSSIHLKVKINQHFSDLISDRHSNPHLQRAFNKYGEDQFSWVVLEEVDNYLLRQHEEKWMKKLDVFCNGYNISRNAIAPMSGRKNHSVVIRGKTWSHLVISPLQSRHNNKSGCVGVYQVKSNRKCKAEIIVRGKYFGLGYYDTKEEAIETRKAAEVRFGV